MEADRRHLEFLVALGADKAPHAKGSLYEHLVGTHHLLAAWQCERHVCTAGLFHSIYSTSIYPKACIDKERRADVVAVIGERAERLVFAFCTADRPRALLRAIGGAEVVGRFDGQRLVSSPQDLTELVEIECANLLEQQLGYAFLLELAERVLCGEFALRHPVASAVESALMSSGKGEGGIHALDS